MRSIIAFLFSIFLSFSLVAGAFAQDGIADPMMPFSSASQTSLMIADTNVLDAKTVDISFSDPIDVQTVRVTIANQATRENVRVGSYTGTMDKNVVRVLLQDALISDTDYTLTINTAMSTEGQTINAGVDAIRDFRSPRGLNA